MKAYVENPFSAGTYELTGGDNLNEAAAEFKRMLDEANDRLANSVSTTTEFFAWDEVDRAVAKMIHEYNIEVKEIY